MKIKSLFDKKFLKFLLVGFVNTLAGDGLMFILYNLAHWNYWLSSASNYIVGGVVSFFLNKYFTFRVAGWSFLMAAGFVVNTVVCYLIAYSVAKPAVNYFLKNISQGLRENIALFTGMCIYTALNYLGQRLAVFKEKP
jgi:putative flippase GtrA